MFQELEVFRHPRDLGDPRDTLAAGVGNCREAPFRDVPLAAPFQDVLVAAPYPGSLEGEEARCRASLVQY